MSNHYQNYLTSILLFLIVTVVSYGQDSLSYEMTFEVNRSSPTVVISPEDYKDIEQYTDLDIHFKSEWIEHFISAEITIIKDGKPEILKTQNHNITDDIRMAMLYADSGQKIRVSYEYLPKNSLQENIVRTDGFSFTISPDNDASFPGGEESMIEYLSRTAMNQVTIEDIDIYNLAAIKFTVSDSGDIINPQVVQPSNHPEIDTLLLNAICDMPSWDPASYDDGTRIAQDYVFTVGDHSSCVINVLDIRNYSFKE